MNYFDILLAKKLEDDRDPKVEGLSVNKNGTYSEDGVVYKPVVVALPLDKKTITANGTYKASDDDLEGYNEVEVEVPMPANAHLLKSAETYPIAPSLYPLPKAEVTFSGNKAELYVGSEPIVVAEDNAPYVYRQSPQNKSAVDLSLVGGTVAWNQLAKSTRTTTTINDVSFTKNANGSYTVNGTASAEVRFYIEDTSTVITKSMGGHKVYLRGCPSGGSLSTYFVAYMNGAGGLMDYSYSADVGNGKVSECHSSGFQNVGIIIKSGTQINNLTFKPNFIDLTQAFGSTIADYIYSLEQATAGSGIAWLKSYGYLTKDYYAYQSGKLESVNVASRKVVGFNQWDEEWEVGAYNTNNGEKANTNVQIRSKNYIKVLPNVSYYWKIPYTSPISGFAVVLYYDANKNYIGYQNMISNGDVLTVPSNCRYATFFISTLYGTTYNNDICINISDTVKNGTYEPYTSTTYDFDSSKILRGISKLSNGNLYYDGDVYNSDGTITRNYEQRAYQSGDESLADAITDGTNTVVKLSTPTTESATPFTNPQLVGSTEEFVDAQTRDVDIPVGQDSNYANSDIYISYGTSPIDMAKEHSIVPYTSTYIDSNGSEDVEYWEEVVS